MQYSRSPVNRSAAPTRQPRPPRQSRYAAWTIEELRGLAGQLQLPNASGKTRRELLELLAGDSGG